MEIFNYFQWYITLLRLFKILYVFNNRRQAAASNFQEVPLKCATSIRRLIPTTRLNPLAGNKIVKRRAKIKQWGEPRKNDDFVRDVHIQTEANTDFEVWSVRWSIFLIEIYVVRTFLQREFSSSTFLSVTDNHTPLIYAYIYHHRTKTHLSLFASN